ncbi:MULTISPECIES: DUF4190 domain-containing protein [Isoptericola]|uniref:DUF4190 domain-containing protein n=1 Tax=Isoptericola TaxID=254250 RepID=UPI00383BE44C
MTDPYQPPQPYSTPDSSGDPGKSHSGAPQADPTPPAYGQGYGQQPGYGQTPYGQPGYAPVYAPDPPGKTMGIIGFVLAFVLAPAGIVVSAMALSESKKVGYDNALGKWGLWLSIIFTSLGVLAVIAYIGFFVFFFGAMGVASSSYY